MSMYKELDCEIRMLAKNQEEYKRYKELVTRHFEGQYVVDEMPDELIKVVTEWETRQLIQG